MHNFWISIQCYIIWQYSKGAYDIITITMATVQLSEKGL